MKKSAGKILFFILLQSFLAAYLHAGNPSLRKVVVVSGGLFGAPGNYVKFSAYDPQTKQNVVFDSVPGSYTNFALVDKDGTAYLSADSFIYIYNLKTYQRLDSLLVPGIQRMAILDSVLIVSRGYGARDHYVQFFNKKTHKLLKSDNTLTTYADGIATQGNIYVAVRGSFGVPMDSGLVAEYAASTLAFKRYIVFDSLQGISGLFAYGNKLYAASPGTDKIGICSLDNGHITYAEATGITDFALTDVSQLSTVNRLWYNNGMAVLPLNMAADTAEYAASIHGGYATATAFDYLGDSANGHAMRLFTTYTDYTTYGYMLVQDLDGKVLDSVPTGISPQAIAFYTGNKQGSNIRSKAAMQTLAVYPNPAASHIGFQLGEEGAYTVNIVDVTGKSVYTDKFMNRTGQSHSMDVSHLQPGMYIVSIQSEGKRLTARFVKE